MHLFIIKYKYIILSLKLNFLEIFNLEFQSKISQRVIYGVWKIIKLSFIESSNIFKIMIQIAFKIELICY